jgi:hypothetical protein
MLQFVVDQMKISAAYAARTNIDQQLPGTGRGIWHLLLTQ